MRFSETFNIERGDDDDWFDPHLTVDTKLFLDPLLLLIASQTDPWTGAHDELIAHFARCYMLVARGGNPDSVSAGLAKRLLAFPEPSEFCLGYTARGTRGLGSGSLFAQKMLDGIAVAIATGLDQPEHIEEITILNVGIGANRISDCVFNVLKHRFVTYTRDIAQRHDVPLVRQQLRNARVFPDQGRRQHLGLDLPQNPFTGQPILLTPRMLLCDLPTVNAEDWWDSQLDSDLRAQMNLSIGQRVSKHEIVRLARRHPGHVRQWAREQTSRPDLAGYDFTDDPRGVVQWDREPRQYAEANPISTIRAVETQDDLDDLIAEVLAQFKRFIEDQRGWSLLWDQSGKEKPEEAAQLLLLGLAQQYLRGFNVEIDREVEMGHGPVDFKISSGTSRRLLIEIKKEHNGKFWNGLDRQLPIYLQGDDCDKGWFVAIRYRTSKVADKRLRALPRRVRDAADATGRDLRYVMIDARRRASASR